MGGIAGWEAGGVGELIENGIPILPDDVVAVSADSVGDGLWGTGVGDFKLFESIGRRGITTGFGFAAGTHGCDAEGHHAASKLRDFACGV